MKEYIDKSRLISEISLAENIYHFNFASVSNLACYINRIINRQPIVNVKEVSETKQKKCEWCDIAIGYYFVKKNGKKAVQVMNNRFCPMCGREDLTLPKFDETEVQSGDAKDPS